jgi:molybdopterin-guanine dinucleotide biosynthesis protein A
VIGAIIAGGGNKRFGGEPKGLHVVDGLRIIDRIAAALRIVTDDLVLVANAPDAGNWLPGVRVTRDAREERGSLVGIHTALVAAAGDDVLLVSWDMPFVSSELLGAIRARLTPGTSAAVPEGPTGLEPFCAAYSASTRPAVEAAIMAGKLRVSRLIASLPHVERLSDADVQAFGSRARLFFNVNTPADLAEAQRMAREP